MFTDRELKIIHSINILRNHNLAKATPEMKKDLVIASLQLRGIKFDELEIIKLSKDIHNEVNYIINETFELYAKNLPWLRGFNLNNLKL